MQRYLGIDLGEKRIGLALSDPTLTIAQPLMTLRFTGVDGLARELLDLVKAHHISRIVVGLPLTMKGTFSAKTTETLEIVETLRTHLAPLPVHTLDERLTTVQAHLTLRAMNKQPSRERELVDQIAAVHMLQAYLDRERQRSSIDD